MDSNASQDHPVEIDPLTLQESTKLWNGFMFVGKYLIIMIAVVLLLMAFFLV